MRLLIILAKMGDYQLILRCSCGFVEVLTEMAENALQIHIGSSDITEEHNELVLDCKQCGTKIALALVKKPSDVSTEVCNAE